jgi:hypothetical protein
MRRLLAILAICACWALAADISGNWKATAEGPNGSMERTFTFKVEGNKVTGETTSSMLGKSTITDGKIEGDTVTFSITADFGGNEMKIDYKGKISGDEIKLTSTTAAAEGQSIEWVAKRVQ